MSHDAKFAAAVFALVALIAAFVVTIALLVESTACAQMTSNPNNPGYWSPVNPGSPLNYMPGGVYGPKDGGGCG